MTKAEQQYKAAEAKLETYIGEHHLRHTQERCIILRHICELETPFCAEDVLESVKADFISQGTVYNTLQLLMSARILQEIHRPHPGNKTEYELQQKGQAKMLMVCQRCGREVEIKDKAIESIVRLHKYSNFNMEHFSLYIYGECKVCRRLTHKTINH